MRGDLVEFDSPTILSSDRNEFIQSCIMKIMDKTGADGKMQGWVDLPENKKIIKELTNWKKRIPSQQKNLVVLGIGGSSLGLRAASAFLGPFLNVRIFDNIDAESFERQIEVLDLSKCHFLAISKSGETSETLFQLGFVADCFSRKKKDLGKHLTVLTEDKKSTLRQIGSRLGAHFISMPQDVGGRYSVLSSVGLAPMFFAGADVEKILKGARWAQNQLDLIHKMIATYWQSFDRDEWISVFWFYSDRLGVLGLWLEQLWAESLGKKTSRDGKPAPRTSTPKTCIGATDQHSLLQQFQDGASDKFFTFVRCDQSEKKKVIKQKWPEFPLMKGKSLGELLAIEADATKQTLEENGRKTCRLRIKKYGPEELGALFFLLEVVVAGLGECLGINPFDQPGVEAVKKLTFGTLGDARYSSHRLS